MEGRDQGRELCNSLIYKETIGGREGFELDSVPLSDQQVTDSENNPVPDDPQETP